MSIQVEEINKEFIEIKNFFSKVGFELIGTTEINNDKIYLIKEKSH
ncbi:MAG: hypothetical protein ACFFCV_20170 [Promethearchaeota archaeon]